jgi:NAD(P)-dependent dehydrogenase (short-subunit alcohol dehydrogenase family)
MVSSPAVARLCLEKAQLFEGKVALVVGASRGIGAATASLLARSGARVVLASRDKAALADLSEKLGSEGFQVCVSIADVGDADSLARIVDFTYATFGALDVAVNNAAVGLAPARLGDTLLDDFDSLMHINVRGIYAAMKYELSAMAGSGGGAIVNVSSIGGLVGSPGRSSYVCSKHAVVGITKSAALEYARDNIRVNAVAPGATMTDLIKPGLQTNPEIYERLIAAVPMGRWAQPDEIANAIVWLASDLASFVTGVVLPVDGGFTVP